MTFAHALVLTVIALAGLTGALAVALALAVELRREVRAERLVREAVTRGLGGLRCHGDRRAAVSLTGCADREGSV